MTDGTGRAPQSIILGLTIGEWPVMAFSNDASGIAHATSWISEQPTKRRLWECTLINVRELEYVPPGEAKLVRKS